MNYIRFFLLVTTTFFSFKLSAMDAEETPSSSRPYKIPPNMSSEEIITLLCNKRLASIYLSDNDPYVVEGQPSEEIITLFSNPSFPLACYLNNMLFNFKVSRAIPREYVITLLQSPMTIYNADNIYTSQQYYTACGANNAHCALGRKYQLELAKLIKENFDLHKGSFYPKKNQDPELLAKFEPLVHIFHHDNQLKVMLAQSLFDKGNNIPLAHEYLAQAILSEGHQAQLYANYGKSFFELTDSWERHNQYVIHYWNILEQEPLFEMKGKGNILKHINTYCNTILMGGDLKQYIKNNKLRLVSDKSTNVNIIKDSLVAHCQSALSLFTKSLTHFSTDVFCLSLEKKLCSLNNGNSTLRDLSKQLYEGLGDKAPSSLKMLYATYYLPSKSLMDAITLVESVLGTESDPDNFFQTAEHYHNLGRLCSLVGQEEKANNAYQTALTLGVGPLLEWSLAFSNIKLGNYNEQNLEKMKTFARLSNEDIRSYREKPSLIHSAYTYALQRTGKTEELSQHFLSKLQKALEKNKKRGAYIKTVVEAEHHEKQEFKEKEKGEKKQREEQQRKIREKAQQFRTSSSSFDEGSSHKEHFDPTSNVKKEKDEDTGKGKNEKKKTKGTPDKNKDKNVISPESTTSASTNRSYISIESLTPNKQAHNIFYKLFSKYRKGIYSDSNIKISLNKINAFFKAIKQGYNPSQGKGSHKKATLDLTSFHIETKEQMVTLTNKTYLKPEQIKALRDAFISARVLPQDEEILEKLKKDLLIESDATFGQPVQTLSTPTTLQMGNTSQGTHTNTSTLTSPKGQ